MKSLMKVLTRERRAFNTGAEVSAVQGALGLLLADRGRHRALIRAHCAGGRCVNPVRPGADPETLPVGHCTSSFIASQSLSPPVGADGAKVCQPQG